MILDWALLFLILGLIAVALKFKTKINIINILKLFLGIFLITILPAGWLLMAGISNLYDLGIISLWLFLTIVGIVLVVKGFIEVKK